MTTIELEKKSATALQWVAIESKMEKVAELKRLNRLDDLGLHVADRALLMIQIHKLDRLIESLNVATIGSDKINQIKEER